MSPIRSRLCTAAQILIGFVTAALSGCHRSQVAASFESDGFRFTPPAGWSLRTEGAVPPSRQASVVRERELIRYKRLQASQPAWLTVSMTENAGTPATVLAQRPIEAGWKPSTRVESTTISGLPAARLTLAKKQGKQALIREIVAVRANRRVYFFIGTYAPGDTVARDQVRDALASAAWSASPAQVASR